MDEWKMTKFCRRNVLQIKKFQKFLFSLGKFLTVHLWATVNKNDLKR